MSDSSSVEIQQSDSSLVELIDSAGETCSGNETLQKSITNIRLNNFDAPENKSCQMYLYKSAAAQMLHDINTFRISHRVPALLEDSTLFDLAFEHSQFMAKNPNNFDTKELSEKILRCSYVCFEAHVSQHPSADNSITNVINSWETEPSTMKSILSEFNVGAVAAVISPLTKECYFTLILAFRTIIGNSYYRNDSLFSMMLAERCIDVLNDVRINHFSLFPIKYDYNLCEYAYLFSKMNRDEINKDYVQSKIGKYSDLCLAFGKIATNNKSIPKPEKIVEEWLNKIGKTQSFLGNFNRIGVGFVQTKDELKSVIILIRSIQASIVDGMEQIIPESDIVTQIAISLNKFREQHKLETLIDNEDLSEMAYRYSIYVANGQIDVDPLTQADYTENISPKYSAIDVSYMAICEMSKIPTIFMSKWRKNEECLSVILSDINEIGVGIAFDENFICHITVIVGSTDFEDTDKDIVNRIVVF